MAYTTIDDPSDYFETKLWTGNSTDDTAITGLDFAPNFVWIKNRTDTNSHALFDTVRGATKYIESDTTDAEATGATFLKSFTSDGFVLGTGGRVNNNAKLYASWNWKKTADAGFDIVSYSGNNGTNRQISHSLSAKPDMMIVKCRQAGLWKIYHSSLGATKYLVLNDAAAVVDNNSTWNDTEPTSSNFTLGDDGNVNETGETYINYLFAEKKGYSKFGIYTGNGNVDGPFVYTGFKPAWLLRKRTDSTGSTWLIHDSKRGVNTNAVRLRADLNNAEDSGNEVDLLSNGFKIRETGGYGNASGSPYIYMAFAEQPFVTSTGVPACAR